MPDDKVRPHLSVLNRNQVEQVHRYALQILKTTGVRVDSSLVLQQLDSRLGLTSGEDHIVRFTDEAVAWALKAAPPSIQLYNRRGSPALRLNDGRMHFGVGVTALYYQDPQTDKLSAFSRKNMASMARLATSLPHYEVISTLGIVQDVPQHLSDLYGSLELLANTTKPLVLLVSDEASFPHILDMYASLCDDGGDKPFVMPYFNPVSPLVMNSGTLEKMHVAIERGLPIIFSNYGMAGASTPITAAGSLALLLAELLAGLVISQAMHAGAPIALGMLPVYFDMKEMMNFYDPQSILVNLACADMLEYYGLPHCGTSGSGTGWGADLIAADTYWMNSLTYSLRGGGLAPFIGDTLGSKAISPKTLVYVHEIIDQTLRVSEGFQLDDESVVLAEIDKIKPGGSFLGAPSTRQRYKTGYYTSQIFPHWSMEKWQAAGEPNADMMLADYTTDLLAQASAPEDQADLLSRGEALIARFQSGSL